MALATPGGTCDVLIPRDRCDPFAVLAIVKEWEREATELDHLSRAPVNLDEALRMACEDVITPEVFPLAALSRGHR
jgi:hypothetical protein